VRCVLISTQGRCLSLYIRIEAAKEMEMDAEKSLVGRVLKLGELLSYQEGSIVSRTIIDRKTGTVTLFAFDEGQGLSEHTAPYDALVHVVDGEAEITISGRRFRVRQGEIVIMPANEPHSVSASKKLMMILVMIRY